jgi:hypothetical protein
MYVECMELLLEYGADLNDPAAYSGRTPLWAQVTGWPGRFEQVRWLLSHGARPDVRSTVDDETSLHGAVRVGATVEMIRMLLAAGADISAEDRYGQTPLAIARREHRDAIAQLLIASGADAGQHRPMPMLREIAPPTESQSIPGSLGELLWVGCDARWSGGAWWLTQPGDVGKIYTAQAYSSPVKFEVVARTDSVDLRLYFALGQLTFRPKGAEWQLHYRDVVDRQRTRVDGKGWIQPGQWVVITVLIRSKEICIGVDGVEWFVREGAFTGIRGTFGVGPGNGSTVGVKSITAIPLDANQNGLG